MSVSAYPVSPFPDASCWVAFDGPVSVRVAWSVMTGPGHLVPLSDATDVRGRAWAIYYPDGGTGIARVQVIHGT